MAQGFKHVGADGKVRTVDEYRVSLEGEVKDVLRACVAVDGVVREYWPNQSIPTPNPPDPDESNLVLANQSVFIYAEREAPEPAQGQIAYASFDGRVYYGDINADPLAPETVQVFAPTPDAAGQFLYRITVNSFTPGLEIDPIANTATVIDGNWHDVYNGGSFYLGIDFKNDSDVTTTWTSSVTWEFAADDGGGSPVPGTEKQLLITGTCAVVADPGGLDVVLPETPWTLTHRTEDGSNAFTSLRVSIPFGNSPRGRLYGFEGAVKFPTPYTDIYSNNFPEGFQVKFESVSGDPPTSGDGFFDWVPLSKNFIWDLQTSADELLSGVYDVSIQDSFGNVRTKRVTMTSERKASVIPDPGLEIILDRTPIHLTGLGFNEPPEFTMERCYIEVTVRNNGWVYFTSTGPSSGGGSAVATVTEARAWASTANADSNDFTPIAGVENIQTRMFRRQSAPVSNFGEPVGVTQWRSMAGSSYSWGYELTRTNNTGDCKFRSVTTYQNETEGLDQAWFFDVGIIGTDPETEYGRVKITWLVQFSDTQATVNCDAPDNPAVEDPLDPPPNTPPQNPGDPNWPGDNPDIPQPEP